MIYLTIFFIILTSVFIYLYFSLRLALKNLRIQIEEKRASGTNLLLTEASKSQSLSVLTQEINRLFDEFNQIRIASNEEKRNFNQALHNITHDIRTPLTIASGYAQTLQRSEEFDPETVQKIKDNLDQVAHRLQVLLDYQNLLELKNRPELTRTDLTEVVKAQLLIFYDAFTAQNFSVKIDLAEKVFILADKELIARILQNIFGNVLKHGKQQLVISLSEEALLTVRNQSQQEIQHLERLTSRFYSENLSMVESSSGLGLYIAQELTELLEGEVKLDYQKPDFIVKLKLKKA